MNIEGLVKPRRKAQQLTVTRCRDGRPQSGGSTALFLGTIRNVDSDSLAGIPGISVPAGLTRARLPIGLELDGPFGFDTRLLSVALAMEAVLGWTPSPPGI